MSLPAGPLLTLCSVSFNSRPWLELNWDLVRRLNGLAAMTWLVAENSPVDSTSRLELDDARFQVVHGAAYEQRAYASGSYHHGRAMNLLLPHLTTRFALFCDPDFFIVKMGWMQEMVEHMLVQGLGVFGVPWHPRWIYKHRYFPCVHCMCVDLQRVPVDWLNFEPDYPTVPPHARAPNTDGRLWRSKLPDPLKLRKRRQVGQSRDVSWRIANRLADSPEVRVECLQPVFRRRRQPVRDLIDQVLPDRMSLIPKRLDYFTERGFGQHGLPDLDALGWEEFLWRGEPFGFHVRSQPKVKDQQSLSGHLAQVAAVLARLPAGA